jgi:hypothetical protein
MPGLTLDTDNTSSSPTQPSHPHSPARSRSSSPVQPPYSPITPTLSVARLAAGSTSTAPQQPVRVYTHSQPPQTFIPQPALPTETISLDTNPDALALKSALSILQIQRQKATADIQTLQRIKERALANPTIFTEALTAGKIKTQPDQLFGVGSLASRDAADDDGEDSDADSDGDVAMKGTTTDQNSDNLMIEHSQMPAKHAPWPPLPRPQTIIRTPPVNWTQYGVVGESLDKLHADAVARPFEGVPARIGPDGQVTPVEGSKRNEGLGIAAPYVPGRDKIEKGAGTGQNKKKKGAN